MFRRSLAALALFTGLTSAGSGFTGQAVVSGYWPSYAESLLEPQDIPYDAFTHIDWFVASTKDSYDLELEGSESSLKSVVSRAHKVNVTVSMCIGGWDGSLYFSDLVANDTGRTAFAQSIKNYVEEYDLDGVDLDWEFPSIQGVGCNAVSSSDSDNFLAFLSILRSMLPDARLSAAVSITGILGADGKIYNRTGEFANYLDYVMIMDYDVWNIYTSTTGPLGPLYDSCSPPERAGQSAASAAKAWTQAGFPANKLVLGIPSYSHAYTVESSTLAQYTVGNLSSLIYQTKTTDIPAGGVTSSGAGADICGAESPASAVWLYTELISHGMLNSNGTEGSNGWTRYWDNCSQTPFLFNNDSRVLIAYDDPQSYSTKAEWARKHGLAGISMFDLTGDSSDSKLMRAARSQLIGNFTDVGSTPSFDQPPSLSNNVTSSSGSSNSSDAPSSASPRARPLHVFSAMHALLNTVAQQWRFR